MQGLLRAAFFARWPSQGNLPRLSVSNGLRTRAPHIPASSASVSGGRKRPGGRRRQNSFRCSRAILMEVCAMSEKTKSTRVEALHHGYLSTAVSSSLRDCKKLGPPDRLDGRPVRVPRSAGVANPKFSFRDPPACTWQPRSNCVDLLVALKMNQNASREA